MVLEQSSQTVHSVPASRHARNRAPVRPRDLTERLNVFAKAIAVGVLIALLGIGTFGRFYTARFNGLVSTTAMEVGDIAQQLRSGRGLSTQVIRPLALAYGQPNEEGVMPEMLHAPLYPYLLSWLFRARGAGDASVAIFNGLMFLLTGWLIYAIARALWDKTVALLVVAVYFVSVEAIGQALSASGATLAGLLLTVAIWAALRYRLSGHARHGSDETTAGRGWLIWSAIVGGAFGLTYLAGLSSLLLIAPLVVLAAPPGRGRWRQIAIMVIAVLVVMLPWAVRNILVSGSLLPPLAKYVLLTHTQTYPGGSVFQQMPGEVPSPIAFVLTHPWEMVKKFANGLTVLYRGGPNMLSPYLFPFFILGAFLFGHNTLKRSLWRVVIVMLMLQVLSICLHDLALDGLGILLPVAICLAVGSLVEALRRTEASRLFQVAVAAAIFGLVVFPTVSSMVLGGKMPGNPSLASLGLLRDRLAEDAVIASDNPAAVAWYAYKKAVLLPATPSELDSLEQRGIKLHYVYFTHAISRGAIPKGLKPWHELLSNKEAAKYLGEFSPLPQGELLFERVNKRES